VVGLSKDEAATRKVFEFARALQLENLSAEPEPDALDLVARLADEFGVNIAIHNHPQPSRYWNPDVVLEATKGRTKRMGSCSDTGHWTRSGLVPVECLKKLEGRVHELHFKDLSDFGKLEALDVPWGTGKSDARGILAELQRQGFKGLIDVEYETGTGQELEKNVAQCVAFLDQTARELVAARR
jgi:sugar phosphate isomerase/epimerase